METLRWPRLSVSDAVRKWFYGRVYCVCMLCRLMATRRGDSTHIILYRAEPQSTQYTKTLYKLSKVICLPAMFSITHIPRLNHIFSSKHSFNTRWNVKHIETITMKARKIGKQNLLKKKKTCKKLILKFSSKVCAR